MASAAQSDPNSTRSGPPRRGSRREYKSSSFLHPCGRATPECASKRDGSIAPDVTATGLRGETGYGFGWDLETVALAGKQTDLVGRDGESLGGMGASLMTFPEYGTSVSVTPNIS